MIFEVKHITYDVKQIFYALHFQNYDWKNDFIAQKLVESFR